MASPDRLARDHRSRAQGQDFFLPHCLIHATYQPTVMVADAVAGRPEFWGAAELSRVRTPEPRPLFRAGVDEGARMAGLMQSSRVEPEPPSGEPRMIY